MDNLSRKINIKKRGLKQYEKKFLRAGEFPYEIPKSATGIPPGHPRVCYVKQGTSDANIDQLPTRCVASCSSTSSSAVAQSVHPQPSVSLDHESFLDQVPFMEAADNYYHLLRSTKSVNVSPSPGNVLVIPEFCGKKNKLLTDIKIIERKPVSFRGLHNWILWCSCNPTEAEELSTLGHDLNITFTEFRSLHPDCIHIEVGRRIFITYDECYDITPSMVYEQMQESDDHGYALGEDTIFPTASDDKICCVLHSDSSKRVSLITRRDGKFHCETCVSFHCQHLSALYRIINEGNEDHLEVVNKIIEDENTSTTHDHRKPHKPKLVSWRKIPFHRNYNLAAGLNALQDEGALSILMPDDESCQQCGAPLKDGDPVEENWVAYDQATLATNTCIIHAKVFYRPCSSCDAVTIFEGQSKCLLNLGTYLVGYDVLRSYMHSFLHGRRPLFTFYQTWRDVHLDYGNATVEVDISYQRLRHAWNSYLRLLDVDLSSGFQCPQCEGDDGLEPEIVICDGTSVSFQRRMWSWDSDEGDQEYMDLTPSRFPDRVFVEDPQVRKLLLRYSSDDRSKRRTGNLRDLSNNEKATMFDYFKVASPSFHSLLTEIEDNPTIMRPVFQRLLLCLASPSPVCSLIPATEDVGTLLANIYKEVEIQQDPTLWNTLHNQLPIFFDIFQALPSGCQLIRPLLKELWNIAVDPFIDALTQTKQRPPPKNTEMSFFPHLPALQSRGKYIADKSSEKRAKVNQRCQKKYRGHPTLLPGVFTVFCPHGICYGFQVMPNNESPNVPFTILRTRFKKAPKCVIYDNACKLHAYCISRDPLFFKDTMFYVDRLHWDNHKGCSLAYDLSLYPLYTHINSQCNEQANAGLQRIKDQLSYMTADNFMFHCSLYLWNKNLIKLQGVERVAKVIQ